MAISNLSDDHGQALLSVRDLNVSYDDTEAVSGIDFDLDHGGSLSLIGQSGSGKSTIAKAILRLLPSRSTTARGRVEFRGQNLLELDEASYRSLRGRQIGYIPQDPQNSLNQVRTIGSQAHEAAELIPGLTKEQQKQEILEAFVKVGLLDVERIYNSYPHQLSGGQLQRVLIGLTVLPKPSLIVADEPTSALDVTIQKLILDLLSKLQQEFEISLLLITHDLTIAAERTERVIVLKDGRVQEAGASSVVFTSPSSAYARKLQSDVPALNPDRYRLEHSTHATQARSSEIEPPEVEVENIRKVFHTSSRDVVAVDGVSFAVRKGRTHALVGESGSGKTTLVRLLLGLEQADSGTIVVGANRISDLSPNALRRVRRQLSLVYQNPFTSLDPTWSVTRTIREPLDRFRVGSSQDRNERVLEVAGAVGLDASNLKRRPTELSGGQRQRVAIARALALRAEVIILDEPTSALDVTIQAEIIEVLFELQSSLGLTYVFVSHDLSLVRQVADTVSVLRLGRKVEEGPVETVFSTPQHEYTKKLVASIPTVAALHRV